MKPFASAPKNLNDIIALEKIPLEQRLTAKNTYEIFANAAKNWGEKPAIIFLPQGDADENPIIINYKQLYTCITQAANMFIQFGIKSGKVISYLLPNLPQTHFTLWGGEAVGIVNPLSPMLPPEQIASLMQKANSDLLVTVGEHLAPHIWHNVLEARKIYPSLKTILVIGGTANESAGIYDFDKSLTQQPTQLQNKQTIATTDICAYFHTSGTTTGKPKLARLTHQGKIYMAWAMGTCFDYQENDVVLVGLPMFHVGAPMVGGLVPFMCGATVVLMSPMGWMGPGVIQNFWKIVERYHGTITAGLNFIYSQLLPIPKLSKNTLRLAISGTAMAPEQAQIYESAGIKVADIYGLTEVTAMATFNPPAGKRIPGSMGLRFPYEQMKIMKDDGSKECAPNEIGQLWISGPNVMASYQASKEKVFMQPNWLNTGDLVRQDAEGYYWMVSRVSDMIKHKSATISALEIENSFTRHPKIATAAVIAQPDLQYGEVPVLYIAPKPNCTLTVAELQQWAKENIQLSSHIPAAIYIEAELPLNGMGKVIKPILRQKNIAALCSRIVTKELEAHKNCEYHIAVDQNDQDEIIAEINLQATPEYFNAIAKKISDSLARYNVMTTIKSA